MICYNTTEKKVNSEDYWQSKFLLLIICYFSEFIQMKQCFRIVALLSFSTNNLLMIKNPPPPN